MLVEITPSEIQGQLEIIIKKLRRLRRKRGRFRAEYAQAKNSLEGYTFAYGNESLRRIGRPLAEFNTGNPKDNIDYMQRKPFFEYIRYKSKLKKIEHKISDLESKYDTQLRKLKDTVSKSQ